MVVGIRFDHLRKMKLFYIFCRHRHTNKPFGMHCHKIDIFCCGKFRSADKIAFIFTIFIIRD